jgi:hypothetical protein
MDEDSAAPRKAQLDKEEREHLENVVTEMRDRVEANVRYQLEEYDLEDRPDEDASLSDEKEDLVEAIELEAVDGNDWGDGYEQYITGVGYTIVNRLAALRCMEVRNFVDEEVTVFREDGLTPAADRLVNEEFMLEEEAVLEAYRNACDDLAEEIEILFDRSTAFSLIDPDDDTYEDLCGMLDEVSDDVWRGDDVLGWVYEYYNAHLLAELRDKAHHQGLDPEDVPAANQFYTPHWVVRSLTDNALGKAYLEKKGTLEQVVSRQDSLTPMERKERSPSITKSPGIEELCTYLVASGEGDTPNFSQPEEIKVIDPACGSGHFLLYAFDILERIWRAEKPEIADSEIPRKILKHNLYGVDLDMRACQLAAFSLYLKARSRAASEGTTEFEMPDVGIVCADAKIAEVEGAESVFEEVAEGRPDLQKTLESILDAFESIHGLGSLLDVRGALSDIFEENIPTEGDTDATQLTFANDFTQEPNLGDILRSLREVISESRDTDSLLAQDLKSFVRLLDVLAQDYDVALMNPPYGSKNKMPDVVQDYVKERYSYTDEFYINFFELCTRLTNDNGRIGMLVPRTFMFKDRYEEFRRDFIGEQGSFDFLAEYGEGILDNATVRTAGAVVRSGTNQDSTGTFIRLHDVKSSRKEEIFSSILSENEDDVSRLFEIELDEFRKVPRSPICYSIPGDVRRLHDTDIKIDAEQAGISGESIADALLGLSTANDDRFARFHWEIENFDVYKPISKGGSDAWVVPKIKETVEWENNGEILRRSSKSIRTRNEDKYGMEGLAWTYVKETGRRFGYFPDGGLFSHAGYMLFPEDGYSLWNLMAVMNSNLYHCLILSQTTDRFWNAGEIGAIPWYESFEEVSQLGEIAQEQYRTMLREHMSDPKSPYYRGAALLPNSSTGFFYSHPHTEVVDNSGDSPSPASEESIKEATLAVERKAAERRAKLEKLSRKIDRLVYSELDVSEETQSKVEEEIFLRTGENPEDRKIPDPDSVSASSETLESNVEELVHHLVVDALREEADGIIPLEGPDEQADILDKLVERFEDAYGEYAEDRLVEVDNILGAESAADEAYPNLRSFIEDDLFAYHVDTMENTPIVWKLSTKRLLADAKGEGFACFVDYHQLDASLFDRLSNQYLEPRKAELRERRSAANQRRNDESLSTSDRADATDEFEFCSSALEQIAELEEVMQELGSTSERDLVADDRERIIDLAPKVATFREDTAERIETLAELREMNGEEWFQDTFSDGFWDKVDEWRDEWVDALEKLEYACEEYAKPSDEPVEAHLADLFDYFNWRLKGSDHYSSTGILFMTYYFEHEGSKLLDDDGQPFDNLTEDEEMLASLATGVDDASVLDEEYLQQIADDEDVDDVDDLPPLAEFKALAEEIDDRCQTVDKQIPSDWSDRALSEITTAGYQPNHKHGVTINITPLAEKSVVPEIVEDKIL